MRISDWSSDVCSSYLEAGHRRVPPELGEVVDAVPVGLLPEAAVAVRDDLVRDRRLGGRDREHAVTELLGRQVRSCGLQPPGEQVGRRVAQADRAVSRGVPAGTHSSENRRAWTAWARTGNSLRLPA